MKIAFITNAFSATGGVGKYSVLLANAFHARGHQVHIVHDDPAISQSDYSFSIFYAPGFSNYESLAATQNDLVLASLARFSPHIVHVQTSMNYSLENEIRKRYPAVKSLHVYDFCPSGTKYHYATEKACTYKPGPMCVPRMIYKRCTHDKNPATLWMFYRRAAESHRNDLQYSKMLVASEYVKAQALQAGYKASQAEVLPYFTSLPETQTPYPSGGEKILMAVGRMVAEKGFGKLLEAAALLKKNADWKIIFDGDGGELRYLKQKAQELGLSGQTAFPGWLPEKEHHELYEKSYAVIVPSVWPEPFGLVGIEAMSYAKPVVAFQSGGIGGWLSNGETGYAVPAGDVRMLAEKIDFLLEHPETAKKMGENGFKNASRNYIEKIHINRLIHIYGEIISNFKKGSIHASV